MERGVAASCCCGESMMIKNDKECRELEERLREERARLLQYREELEADGLNPLEVQRALDPLEGHHLQLQDQLDHYRAVKSGQLEDVHNLRGLGRRLIDLRLARGVTQRSLARCLDVHESAVSRDERNEYHGITVERASRVLDALNACMVSRFEAGDPPSTEPGIAERE